MTHIFSLSRTLTLTGLLLSFTFVARAQSVGIGTTAPEATAVLELKSSTQGLLLPRLTQAQRDAIGTPPGGLVVFQTDNTPGLYAYSGASWVLLSADNLGSHTATQNLSLADKTLVGQTDANAAVGTTGLRVYSGGQVGVGTPRTLGSNNDFHAGLEVNSDQGILATGTYVGNSTTEAAQEGAGTRLLWHPARAAFRAGSINGTQWDDANMGNYSVAMGYNTRASADYATAFGNSCVATQVNTFTAGEGNTASGAGSVALGYYAHTNSRQGSFVFADRSNAPNGNSTVNPVNDFRAQINHSFNVRASGGYFFYTNAAANVGVSVAAGGNAWTTLSDSTRKERLRLADGNELLRRVGRLRLGSWNYKGQSADTMRHYAPWPKTFSPPSATTAWAAWATPKASTRPISMG